MKRIALFLAVISVVIFNLPSPSAALYVHNFSGINVTEDTNTGYYWYWDLGRFSGMTYDEQLLEISTISVPGYTGTWNMATQAQMDTLTQAYTESHLMNGFAPAYKSYFMTEPSNEIYNIEIFESYRGRLNEPYPGYPGRYYIYALEYQVDIHENVNQFYYGLPLSFYWEYSGIDGATWPYLSAWVVSTDLVAASPVPEPATMLLLGSGLVGLAGFRRKFRKH